MNRQCGREAPLGQSSRDPLLQVRGLTVRYRPEGGAEVAAVNQADFTIASGEAVGLLGESGCGKTTLALSLLRLLPTNTCEVRGSILLGETELMGLGESQLRQLRGAMISIIFQEPEIALNPVMRVGDQIAEVIRAHRPWGKRRCLDEAGALLDQLHFTDANRIFNAYPHQLSGGQRQRAVIAQAIACKPALVIADEPTTALDPTVQSEVLTLFIDLKERFQTAFLFISHNPAILAKVVDRILVMYAGRIVEEAETTQILRRPLHPYTAGLMRCVLEWGDEGAFRPRRILPTIPGSPPDPADLMQGCPFEPRCPERMEVCTAREPQEVQAENSQRVRCFKYGG